MRSLLLALPLLAGCASTTSTTTSGPTLRALYALPKVTRIDASHTALVLVDFQEEFFHGKLTIDTAPRAAERARELLAWARGSGITVIHVRNVTKPGAAMFAPESPTTQFAPGLGPVGDELVLTKPTGGGFTKTDLDAQLHARGIDTIIVGGIMAHLAVAMTAQDGAVLGYHVIVAADATTTRALPGQAGQSAVDADTVKRVSLSIIADRFADVMTNAEIRALPR